MQELDSHLAQNKRIVLAMLRRYHMCFLNGGKSLHHSLDEILSCLDYSDIQQVYRKELHCNDEVCISIMLNFIDRSFVGGTILEPPPSNEKIQEEIVTLAEEIQYPRYYDGVELDFSYNVSDVSIQKRFINGVMYHLVGDKDKYFDCVGSTEDSHLYRKPHHYRRAYAMSRQIDLIPPVRDGNIGVIDSYPYNHGTVGGYYQIFLPNRINVYSVSSKDHSKLYFRNEGVFDSKWYYFKTITGKYAGCFEYDKEAEEVVSKASYASSVKDSTSNYYSKFVFRKEDDLQKVNVAKYQLEIIGVGVGLRDGVFRICNQYRVSASIKNAHDVVRIALVVRDEDSESIINQISSFARWRRCRFKVISREDVMDTSLKKEVKIMLSV